MACGSCRRSESKTFCIQKELRSYGVAEFAELQVLVQEERIAQDLHLIRTSKQRKVALHCSVTAFIIYLNIWRSYADKRRRDEPEGRMRYSLAGFIPSSLPQFFISIRITKTSCYSSNIKYSFQMRLALSGAVIIFATQQIATAAFLFRVPCF